MYTSKSTRINSMIEMNETIRCIRKDNRYAVAFVLNPGGKEVYDVETGETAWMDDDTIVVQYGYVGMPHDYRQELTPEEAETAIRDFNDLRGWRVDGEWWN